MTKRVNSEDVDDAVEPKKSRKAQVFEIEGASVSHALQHSAQEISPKAVATIVQESEKNS